MTLVFGTLLDPIDEQGFLTGRQALSGVRRRHAEQFVLVADFGHQLAGRGVARHDRLPRQGYFAPVQPQVRLPRIPVRAVAGEAVVGEDRTDIPVEANVLAKKRNCGQDDRGNDR